MSNDFEKKRKKKQDESFVDQISDFAHTLAAEGYFGTKRKVTEENMRKKKKSSPY